MSSLKTMRKARVGIGLCFLLLLAAAAQVSLAYYRNGLAQYKSEVLSAHRALAAEVGQLHVELANLSRPERLRRLARSELGMAPPSPLQVLRP